jgi:hypothetical protein
MNASLAALTGALLIACCPWATAASSVDLRVKGSITPSACTPSLSNGGLVDYGKLSMQDLDPTGLTELPKVTFKMAVNCEGRSLFALAVNDNRSPTLGATTTFRLGAISPTLWIGHYYIGMKNILPDDPAAYAIYSLNNGSTWQYNHSEEVIANSLLAFGNLSSGAMAPIPLTDISLDLQVEPIIFPKSTIPAGQTIPLDGSATFELRYL